MGERGDGEEGQSEVNGARLACKLQLARESLTWAPTPSERTNQLTQPLVTDNSNEVLWWQGLKNGHEKVQNVLLLCIFLLKEKILVMEQNLAVHIFHKDPKRFRVSVHFFVPLEVGSDSQFHLERGPTQGKREKGK